MSSDQTLRVADERIESVGPTERNASSAATTALDLDGAWALPGLIDMHTHLTLHRSAPERNELDIRSIFPSVRSASEALAGGVTTCRDVGGYHHTDIALRDATARGDVIGPRILAAGRPVAATGGHIHYFCREADGVAEVRKAVREQIKGGADLIKLMVTGGSANTGERPGHLQMRQDEIEAATAEAAAANVPVAAHAHTTEAILHAVRAGVRTIEHGGLIDDDAIQALLDHDCALIPTQAVYARLAANTDNWPPAKARAAQVLYEQKRVALGKALAAGVRIGVGTDSGRHFPHGQLAREMCALTDAGAEPEEVLHWATAGNAEILGLSSRVGAIESGKLADFVIYGSDPRVELGALSTPQYVVCRGQLYEPEQLRQRVGDGDGLGLE